MASLQEALREIVRQSENQRAVAERAGVSQATISRILRGKRMGSMRTYQRLVQAYPQLGEFFVSPNIPICMN